LLGIAFLIHLEFYLQHEDPDPKDRCTDGVEQTVGVEQLDGMEQTDGAPSPDNVSVSSQTGDNECSTQDKGTSCCLKNGLL